MVKCGVLFEVRTGFLNNIYTIFVFKVLKLLTYKKFHLCVFMSVA
jgi:hypothetical protein